MVDVVRVAGVQLPASGVGSWDRASLRVVHEAFDGQIGVGQVAIRDAGDLSTAGGRSVTVTFDDGGAGEAIICEGFLGSQIRTRPHDDALLRMNTYAVQDTNAILAHRNVNDWRRPRETDVKRIKAAIRRFVPALNVSVYVPDTNTVSMPRKRYRDTSLDEIIQDCLEMTGKTWFVDLQYRFHWHRLNEDVGFDAAIVITDQSPDLVTEYPPSDPNRSQDPYDLANKIRVYNDRRAKIVKDSTSIATHDADGLKHQDQLSYTDSNEKAPDDLGSFGNAALLERKNERTGYQFRVRHLPDPSVIQAGQRIEITSEILGLTASTQRISRVAWSTPAPGVWDADVECGHPRRLPRERRRRKKPRVKPRDIQQPEADTSPHTVDGFDRVVAAPTHIAGSAISATPVRQTAYDGVDTAGAEQTFDYGSLASNQAGSWVGWSYLVYTDPNNPCDGFYPGYMGWREQEVWYELIVPTHPANMAGMYVTLTASLPSTGGGVASANGFDVHASTSEPAALRSGTPVGHIPAPGSGTVFIPSSAIPAAGQTLYIGVIAGWACDYGDYVCAYNLPQRTGMGNSGRGNIGYSSAQWRVWDVGSETSIGDTDADTAAAPFNGPFTWVDAGEDGSPVYEMDGDCLIITSTAAAGRGWRLPGPREDEELEWAPWSDFHWGCRFTFEVDPIGNQGQDGERHLELTTVGQEQRAVARVHFGDKVHPPGVSVYGPTEVFKAKTLTGATRYRVLVDTRSGMLKAKVWQAGTSMPTKWDASVALTDTIDDADYFMMWGRVGNITAEQALKICSFEALAMADEGERVVNEYLGTADGSTSEFYTHTPYRHGTLRIAVDGVSVKPVRQWGDECRFKLDRRPSNKAKLHATYTAAGVE